MRRVPVSDVRSWSKSGPHTYPGVVEVTCPFCNRMITLSISGNSDGLSMCLHGECPGCHETVRFWQADISSDETSAEIYMYPQSAVDRDPLEGLEHVPEGVRRSYLNTLASYKTNNWPATAVMCRRTLEGIVFEVTKIKAAQMPLIKGLAEIPKHIDLGAKVLQPMQALRQGGNLGAHYDEEREPNQEVAEAMLSFLDYILEFVYVLPHKAEALSHKIEGLGPRNAADAE